MINKLPSYVFSCPWQLCITLYELLYIQIQSPSLGAIYSIKILLDAVLGIGSFHLFASVDFSAGLREPLPSFATAEKGWSSITDHGLCSNWAASPIFALFSKHFVCLEKEWILKKDWAFGHISGFDSLILSQISTCNYLILGSLSKIWE